MGTILQVPLWYFRVFIDLTYPQQAATVNSESIGGMQWIGRVRSRITVIAG